jgi:hypothetical protein
MTNEYRTSELAKATENYNLYRQDFLTAKSKSVRRTAEEWMNFWASKMAFLEAASSETKKAAHHC